MKLPILQFQTKCGPPLNLGKVNGPALSLQAVSAAPVLRISLTEPSSGPYFSNFIPALVFIVLGCLASLITVPLSQGSQWARLPMDQLIEGIAQLTSPLLNQEEDSSSAPLASVELEETAEVPTQSMTPLALLNGVNCPAYFAGDKPSDASSAFDEHIWSKLSKELQDQAVQRLDVCSPFEMVEQDLIAAQGCAQHECGTNDVRFYLSADNKAAIEMHVDGQCTQSAESGFRHTNLLCAPR